MGLIDYHHIPVCRQGLRLNIWLIGKQVTAAQYQLLGFEWIFFRMLGDTFGVKQGKVQVKAAGSPVPESILC
jgi:hypothetical protein